MSSTQLQVWVYQLVSTHIKYENTNGPGCRKVPLNENMPLYTMQSQNNLFPIIKHIFRNSNLEDLLPFIPWSSKWQLNRRIPYQILYHFCSFQS